MGPVPCKPPDSWAAKKDKERLVLELSKAASSEVATKWNFASEATPSPEGDCSTIPPQGTYSDTYSAFCTWRPIKCHQRPSRNYVKGANNGTGKILADIASLVGKR